jgi:zinc transporter 9
LPLLFGFTFMLVVEQLSSSHAHHHHTHRLGHHTGASRDSVFDVELAGLESEEEDIPRTRRASAPRTNTETDSPPPAYPITIGLVVHGLADGLALGMSVLSNDDPSSSYSLSLVVFLALAVHKGTHSRHIYFFPPLFMSLHSCSSYGPCLHCVSHVNLSLAGRV